MKIQYLNGGLANQVFQYIFVRFAELYYPAGGPWFLDDSFFFANQVHNGYEREKVFGIQANLLSRYFDADVWQELIRNRKNGISLAQSFADMDLPIEMIAETTNYKTHNPFRGKIYRIPSNEFHPEITKLPGNATYYHGYWIHPQWFRSYQNILRKELSFPSITDAQNQKYADLIASSNSIAVHIRRGDYIDLGWGLSASYYLESMQKALAEYRDAVFFIFSDDLNWCRNNASSLGFHLTPDIIYVEGNTGNSNYRDMQLMSMCRRMIMSNSAFCYLAALLGNSMEILAQPAQNIGGSNI